MGHNDCVCLHGRVNGECRSLCDSRCKNGSCVEEKCVCNEGYADTTPKHSLAFMFYDEYDYNSGEETEGCQPVCENCTNGQCVAPNECKCNEGYAKLSDGSCQPSCSNCTSGGICVAPGECRCLPGYKMSDSKCIPHCFGHCPDHKCIKPGVCECGENFFWSNFVEECVPKCVSMRCKPNERCMGTTGTCDCTLGYKRNTTTSECDPICDNGCVNGYCSAPNICSCNENFTHLNATHCQRKCDPTCPRNAECQDGTCVCSKGYTKYSSICLKNCPCTNAYCSDYDNECRCRLGYFKNPKNSSECISECELDGCENGFCTSKLSFAQCKCHKHYQMDKTAKKCIKCEEGTYCNGEFMPYTCNPPCEHGICVEKDTCACHHGYDKTEKSHVCEPVCYEGCANGVCHNPHNCTCNEGFEKVDDKCQPVCVHKCVNGICSAPDVCNCTEGHEFVPNSKHKCEKIKCHHGEHHKGHKDCQTEAAPSTDSQEHNGNTVWFV